MCYLARYRWCCLKRYPVQICWPQVSFWGISGIFLVFWAKWPIPTLFLPYPKYEDPFYHDLFSPGQEDHVPNVPSLIFVSHCWKTTFCLHCHSPPIQQSYIDIFPLQRHFFVQQIFFETDIVTCGPFETFILCFVWWNAIRICWQLSKSVPFFNACFHMTLTQWGAV